MYIYILELSKKKHFFSAKEIKKKIKYFKLFFNLVSINIPATGQKMLLTQVKKIKQKKNK